MQKKFLRVGLASILVGVVFGVHNCAADKYPTFQVRGGSVFTYGNENNGNVGVETKSPTVMQIGGEQRVFSSWVEYGAFSNGYMNSGFASGAATGFGFDSGGGESYCKNRTTLSFANDLSAFGNNYYDCPNGGNDGRTGLFNYDYPTFSIDASIERARENAKSNEEIILRDNGDNDTVLASEGQETISGHVIVVAKNVTIEGNIVYGGGNNGYYGSLEQVPKLLIYATKSINIHCNVSRVDAVLFAGGDVNTCSDVDDVNDEKRSRQLVINGAIVAKNVYFQRTYGAVNLTSDGTLHNESGDYLDKCQATNASQRYCASIPAEIVNYDASIVTMGNQANSAVTRTNLVTIYQRELSPRY